MIVAVVGLLAAVISTQQAAGQTDAASNTSVTTLLPPIEPFEAPLLPEFVETNGTLVVSGDGVDGLYGSTVRLRQSKGSISDVFTVMMDTRHALPAGVLQYFYLFAEQNNPSPSLLALQVWRRYDAIRVDNQYQLVWQRHVLLNDSSVQALYTFNVSDDKFQVQKGDYIGWTGNYDGNRFISRDDDSSIPPCRDCSRSRYLRNKPMYDWPLRVREEPYVGITPSPRQFVFSAAVRIQRPVTTRAPVPRLSTRAVSTTLRSTPSTTVSQTGASSSTTRVIIDIDHTVATTIGVVFGIFGAVVLAIAAVIIWRKRDDCKPEVIWSALKSKSATQDSRVELLESGSTTPSSTGRAYSDDVDSSSVTTSSSSEANAVTGRRPDLAFAPTPAVAGARPKHAVDLHHPTDRPTTGRAYYRDRLAARDNDGFIRDDDVAKSLVETQRHPLQQQQQQQQPTDAHTHCISVELHTAPHNVPDDSQTGNVSMI